MISIYFSLIRYVHQNPVDAKISDRIEDYIWSSDKDYRTNNLVGMVDIDFILNMLSENRIEAISLYKEFMDENKKEDISVFEQVDIGAFPGTRVNNLLNVL